LPAVSARNAWAAGCFGVNAFSGTALIEHWDGISWTRTHIPHLAGVSLVAAITALSARDTWAVGRAHSGHTDMALTARAG
jgi:Ca2+/Na+ antiporter